MDFGRNATHLRLEYSEPFVARRCLSLFAQYQLIIVKPFFLSNWSCQSHSIQRALRGSFLGFFSVLVSTLRYINHILISTKNKLLTFSKDQCPNGDYRIAMRSMSVPKMVDKIYTPFSKSYQARMQKCYSPNKRTLFKRLLGR